MFRNWNLWSAVSFEGEGGGDGGGGNTGPWFGNIADKAVTTHLESKGWHNAKSVEEGVTALVKGHMSAEQLIGKHANNPLRPGKDATDKDWTDYYGKVRGVNAPEDYKLEYKDGMDKGLFEASNKWFFDNGLDSRQAKNMFDAWNKYNDDELTNYIKQSDADMQELAKEIPVKDFDDYIELSKRAAQHAMKIAGFDQMKLAVVERVIGTKAFMKMFNSFGQMFKEGVAPEGGGKGFEGTPDHAKAEIAKLRADPEWIKRYTSDNPAVRQPAIDQMVALQKLAHGDAPVS